MRETPPLESEGSSQICYQLIFKVDSGLLPFKPISVNQTYFSVITLVNDGVLALNCLVKRIFNKAMYRHNLFHANIQNLYHLATVVMSSKS